MFSLKTLGLLVVTLVLQTGGLMVYGVNEINTDIRTNIDVKKLFEEVEIQKELDES